VDTSLEPLDLSIRRLLGACAY
ncbi:adenylyl-sulfate kinase, partial [Pseudomonas sp. ATCC 13867]